MDDIIEVARIIHDNGFMAVDTGSLNAQVSGPHIRGGSQVGLLLMGLIGYAS